MSRVVTKEGYSALSRSGLEKYRGKPYFRCGFCVYFRGEPPHVAPCFGVPKWLKTEEDEACEFFKLNRREWSRFMRKYRRVADEFL